MEKAIQDLSHESICYPPLSPACSLCGEGAKLVLLISGICPATCYYCPLSYKKGGNDVIYADEWQIPHEEDTDILLKEAHLIEAKGAGITGGDPLYVWQRTKAYVSLLKNTFGESFHIHLYTSGMIHQEKIQELINTGIDEIRFHPLPKYWKKMEKNPILPAITSALNTAAEVAIEIPAIPQMEKEIIHLITWAEKQNINYINLNELEFSERNETLLYQRGFVTKNDISSSVQGSQECAYEIINQLHQKNPSIGIHYCSSSFKDGMQLQNRIKRRARNIARSIDCITEEGTLLKGIIEPKNQRQLHDIERQLQMDYNMQANVDYVVNTTLKRIEVHLDTLEELVKKIKTDTMKFYIIEEYPTADHLEVERIPLSKP